MRSGEVETLYDEISKFAVNDGMIPIQAVMDKNIFKSKNSTLILSHEMRNKVSAQRIQRKNLKSAVSQYSGDAGRRSRF